ncbi:MAG: hypothetical protein LBI13_08425 [Streptococcaceae bacterium]|jgi:hypothetical protein|nr:hypothetical protein [Streptococcaceae bacterium]
MINSSKQPTKQIGFYIGLLSLIPFLIFFFIFDILAKSSFLKIAYFLMPIFLPALGIGRSYYEISKINVDNRRATLSKAGFALNIVLLIINSLVVGIMLILLNYPDGL